MRGYRQGNDVTVNVALRDRAGNTVSPVSITYRVTDESDADLIPEMPYTGAIDGSAVITVPAAHNTLPDGIIRGVRQVWVYMTDAAGNVSMNTESYFVEADEVLRVMENTYQTFATAKLTAFDMKLECWHEASDAERLVGLVEAFHRLGTLSYRIPGVVSQSRLNSGAIRRTSRLNEQSLETFLSYPSQFRNALRRAQIIEADVVLGGDEMQSMRDAGLMSKSVGEVTLFFRSGKPFQGAVNRRTYMALTGYVDFSLRVGR